MLTMIGDISVNWFWWTILHWQSWSLRLVTYVANPLKAIDQLFSILLLYSPLRGCFTRAIFHSLLTSHLPSSILLCVRQCVAQPTSLCPVQPQTGHRFNFLLSDIC